MSPSNATRLAHNQISRPLLKCIQAHLRTDGYADRSSDQQVVNETLPALVKLREQGLVKFIGITGLPLKIFPYILDRCACS